MHTLGDMAKALNRPALHLKHLQTRFGLPAQPGAGYSDAYLACLQTLTHLRRLNVAEATLLDLWQSEQKLLCLLHVDTTGSATWFLDSCGQTTHPRRRLLLTNHDLGVDLDTHTLQPGLNFSGQLPELFASQEMGEDALRVLGDCLTLQAAIRATATAELPHLKAAQTWAKRMR